MHKRKQYVVVRKKKKELQHKKFFKKFIWILLICTLAAIGFIFFDLSKAFVLESPYFQIKNIDITNTSAEEADRILERLSVKIGDNMFRFRSKHIIEKLKLAHPEIKNAIVKRSLPDRLSIQVIYRNPLAQIVFGERMLCVDAEGVIFRLPTLDQQVYLKKMFLPEVFTTNDHERTILMKFLKRIKDMQYTLGQDVVKLYSEIPMDIVYYLSDGTKIIWGSFDEEYFDEKFERLRLVYHDAVKRYSKIKYINMRYWFDGRVVIRPQEDSD